MLLVVARAITAVAEWVGAVSNLAATVVDLTATADAVVADTVAQLRVVVFCFSRSVLVTFKVVAEAVEVNACLSSTSQLLVRTWWCHRKQLLVGDQQVVQP